MSFRVPFPIKKSLLHIYGCKKSLQKMYMIKMYCTICERTYIYTNVYKGSIYNTHIFIYKSTLSIHLCNAPSEYQFITKVMLRGIFVNLCKSCCDYYCVCVCLLLKPSICNPHARTELDVRICILYGVLCEARVYLFEFNFI